MHVEKSRVRLAIDRYLNTLERKPELPVRGVILCPQCQGILHFVLYTGGKLEAKCPNNCYFLGDL